MNGKTRHLLGIKKESNANTVQVCEAVKEELDRLLAHRPFPGWSIPSSSISPVHPEHLP